MSRRLSGSTSRFLSVAPLALSLLLGLAPAQARAAEAEAVAAAKPAVAAANPVTIPGSEELQLRSKAGLDYRIFVYRPSTPPPPSGYPVIYVLDGNAWFGPMAHAMRLQGGFGIVPAVIVGIAYPGDKPFNQYRRFYDFVPDVPLKETVPPGYTPPKFGGADPFLKFIADEVEPLIAKQAKLDPDRRTLFGHSLGCSLTLHALFTAPRSFSSYVCGSPTLGFNGAYVLESEKKFAKKLASSKIDASLVFAVAEYEEKIDPAMDPKLAERLKPELAKARVVSGGRELYQRLAPLSSSGLKTTFIEIPGENHITEVPVLINRMLPIILKPAGNE